MIGGIYSADRDYAPPGIILPGATCKSIAAGMTTEWVLLKGQFTKSGANVYSKV
jgi:hypothetical protein